MGYTQVSRLLYSCSCVVEEEQEGMITQSKWAASPSFLVSDKPNTISFKNQYVKVPKAYAPNRAKLVDFAILLLLKRH